jgi:tetratricopeptide (TPR) repeat protein
MSAADDWRAFFFQQRGRYVEQWLAHARGQAHDPDALEAELANLLSAADHAGEGRDHPSVLELVRLLCVGDDALLDLRGLLSESARLLRLAVDAARALGDRREEGRLLGSLGLCWWGLEQPARALEHLGDALGLARETGDRQAEGRHLGSLGLVWAGAKGYQLAGGYYAEALAIAREVGDRGAEESHLGALGLLWAEAGTVGPDPAQAAPGSAAPFFRKAVECYERALVIARERGNARGEASHLGNLGNAWRHLDAARAVGYLEQARDLARETGDRRTEAFHLANLGEAYHALDRPGEAQRCWREALAVFDSYGDARAEPVRARLEAAGPSTGA